MCNSCHLLTRDKIFKYTQQGAAILKPTWHTLHLGDLADTLSAYERDSNVKTHVSAMMQTAAFVNAVNTQSVQRDVCRYCHKQGLRERSCHKKKADREKCAPNSGVARTDSPGGDISAVTAG